MHLAAALCCSAPDRNFSRSRTLLVPFAVPVRFSLLARVFYGVASYCFLLEPCFIVLHDQW
jgi:hypothetical protein